MIADPDELLNCKSCSDSIELIDRLCDVCIGPHVRRGHKIVDHRGYEMSVCENHKMINDLFCVQCSQVLCNKCLLNHRGHDYVTAAEKRLETRKEIFEFISKFETLNKDIKFHQMIQKDSSKELDEASVIANPAKTVDILVEIIGNYLRKLVLSDAHLSKIDELAKTFNDNIIQAAEKAAKHDSLVNESESMVASLRENLQKSDGVLVGTFLSAVEDMNRSLNDQSTSLKEFVSFTPFHIGGEKLESFASQFLNEFLNMTKWPEVAYQPFEMIIAFEGVSYPKVEETIEGSIFCPSERGYFGVVYTNEETLMFSLLHVYSVSMNKRFCKCRSGNRLLQLGRYCQLCGKDESGQRIVLFKEKDTQIAEQNLTKIIQVKNVSKTLMHFALFFVGKVIIVHACEPIYAQNRHAPVVTSKPFPDIIPANCLLVYSSPEFNALIWDPIRKVIRPLKQDRSVKNISCSEKPVLFTCTSDMNLVAITVSSSENIIIISNDISTQLNSAIHGLQRVDALFLTEKKVLLAWNYRRKICVAFRECLQGSASSWFAVKAFKKPELNDVPEQYNETKWERIEHTQTDVYIFISKATLPWILPISDIIGNLPRP